jgi:membrane-bound ClpP family serine protease
MAAVRYTKADWIAEADIQKVKNGKFQGVVLITHTSGSAADEAQHVVDSISDTPVEALEEAKALAHRILADL